MGGAQGNRGVGAQLGTVATGLGLAVGPRLGELAQVECRGVVRGTDAGTQGARRVIEQQLVETTALVLLGLDAGERAVAWQA